MVQRAVLLLCVAALDIAAASPGDLPVPAWPGAFNLPLLPSQRSPAVFAPSYMATGLALRELVAPFVEGGHCAEPYLAVKGDAGKNATEATRLPAREPLSPTQCGHLAHSTETGRPILLLLAPSVSPRCPRRAVVSHHLDCTV